MFHITRIKAAAAAVAIAGATAAAIMVPASPAVAFSSGGLVLDIKIQSPAHLVANGAALAVPVEYTCFGTSNASLNVSVTEKVGSGVAEGGGFLDSLVCTGEIQTATITIPTSSGKAFIKGTGFSNGEIFGCSSFCGEQTNSATIAIQK
jgi:hypothetical protein